ncbi:MAG: maleate cis-trans isomerase family protein [Gammaproteobacteria bacterium]
MPDIAGYRAKIGVIIPSTNTLVEADFNALRIPGVTFHAGRMYIEQPSLASDADFERLLEQVGAAFETALRDVLTCKPDHIAMAMSAPTFWGGKAGNERFLQRAGELTRLAVTTGAHSCRLALERFGAHRIAVLTPYQPIMREQIVRYFDEVGFDVVSYLDLRCESATAIAEVGPDVLRDAVLSLNKPDVEAIVQAGTNLSMVGLANDLELELGKPVIAINAAIVWNAYRSLGFDDRLSKAGRVLREL